MDAATAEVIRLSLMWAELTERAFDPIRAGCELVRAGCRPCLADQLPDLAATWRDVELESLKIRTTRPLTIDLGGIAKGYAVDLVAEIITAHGHSGIVNAGGDLRFMGTENRAISLRKPDAEGVRLELQEIPYPALATTASNPLSEEGRNLDLVGHKLPPAGISVTVFAENCALADAMTQTVLNLPANKATTILRQLGCSALILMVDDIYFRLSQFYCPNKHYSAPKLKLQMDPELSD